MKNQRVSNSENAFIEACQRMHNLGNACHNWLQQTQSTATTSISAESGCLRSVRLARLKPVTHEVTAQSALQLAVLPAQFDGVRHRGYDRPCWQLLIYSWLGRDVTALLISHLSARMPLNGCTFFLVHADGCERLAGAKHL